jgi:prepilin-type N-terminal cleavage/methylation domain-containing protein
MRPTHRHAFTIIELLVVIGVLGLLMGLLLPALGAAHRKGLKSSEMSAIKQVGIAWNLYATNNREQVLPGFLDPGVQAQWQVSYQFGDKNRVPPAPTYSGPNVAGPWTFRLMSHLDHNHEMVHGYVDEPDYDPTTISGDADEVWSMAYEPGFGYNAFYVGGWWEMESGIPRPRYHEHNVVARSTASIRRPSDLVIFCSSSLLEPGFYRKFPADQKGSHYAVPPWLGPVDQWTVPGAAGGPGGGADPSSVDVLVQTAPPIGRYNKLASTLYADLHTDVNAPGALYDIRKWIDAASSTTYRHD